MRRVGASHRDVPHTAGQSPGTEPRVLTDGGRDESEDAETDSADDADGSDDAAAVDRSNVEVTEAGEAEPADPKWEKPDIDDIPEVEGPKTRPADSSESSAPPGDDTASGRPPDADPTTGMPNTARSPEQSRLKRGGADGYVVALELCARLPEDIRLPEEAADTVPVALEAELEDNVKQFAGDQFDNPSPRVETLDFVDVDGEIWLRLRLGIPPESFTDFDPSAIQEYALQELEGMF